MQAITSPGMTGAVLDVSCPLPQPCGLVYEGSDGSSFWLQLNGAPLKRAYLESFLEAESLLIRSRMLSTSLYYML